MSIEMTKEHCIDKKRMSFGVMRHLQSHPYFNDEIDLGWISEMVKQDLNTSELIQVLEFIDDFIELKEAELAAELQLAEAYKIELIRKYSALTENKSMVNRFWQVKYKEIIHHMNCESE